MLIFLTILVVQRVDESDAKRGTLLLTIEDADSADKLLNISDIVQAMLRYYLQICSPLKKCCHRLSLVASILYYKNS